MRNLSLLLIALVAMTLFSGCMHSPAPYLPSSWESKPIELADIENKDEDRLYIMIMYENTMCAHTTLSIFSPEHGSLFWDPAGSYGDPEFPIRAKRKRDLVVDPIPTVADYLHFRRYIETAKVEIFEFEITAEAAKKMMYMLNVENRHEDDYYSTNAQPLYCSTAISKFLENNASDILPVTKEFYPHNLAKQLYQLNPLRVILWDYRSMNEYTPAE